MGAMNKETEAEKKMVKTALRVGYRHFDTAAVYGDYIMHDLTIRQHGADKLIYKCA